MQTKNKFLNFMTCTFSHTVSVMDLNYCILLPSSEDSYLYVAWGKNFKGNDILFILFIYLFDGSYCTDDLGIINQKDINVYFWKKDILFCCWYSK